MEIDQVLQQLAEGSNVPVDVPQLALYLARDEYPDLDVDAYLSELDGMAREAQAYVRGGLDTRLAGLCRYLFHEMGFHGNTQDYYDARNSYLNEVLDRRTGLPIALSVVAMAVGRRVGLKVVGIGLPGHFVAQAMAGSETALFDPFHGGRRLTLEDCGRLVEQVTGQPFSAADTFLQPVTTGALMTRMLTNLKAVYLRHEDFVRAARVIRRLRQLAPTDPFEERDLGACLARAGQPEQAIPHLASYLVARPGAGDATAVRLLLDRIKSQASVRRLLDPSRDTAARLN
jgi:regulator of sirC expression with transglutaminase-like and TPR domain